MSILTQSLPKNRLNIEGITVNREKKLEQVLELLKEHALTPTQLGGKIGVNRSKTYDDYLKPLLDAGKVKKVDGTKKYTAIDTAVTKETLKQELYTNSEIMQTELFKNWEKNNKSKANHTFMVRFARLCLGEVNQKFKIHPDSINKANWEDIMVNMVDAVLETYPKPQKEPHFTDRQALRHAIMYGLDITISEEKGKRLRISGEKPEPTISDLHITKPQVTQCKLILKKDDNPQWFVKFGFKAWTFVRPSTIYIVQTKDLEFYDRVVKYVEIDGVRNYKKDVIDFMEKLILVFPQIAQKVKLESFTHRACRLQVFEHKTQTDYQKYIWDEDFVIALEKYVAQRKFQKKKYLFWENNDTEFIFETYDKIVVTSVKKDNSYFKKILSQVGFEQSDFGKKYRANYGFRHFGLQMWLEATDYDYDFVATMSHEDTTTLKKWYGKMSAEHHEKRASEVNF